MLPDYEVIPDKEIIGWRGACDMRLARRTVGAGHVAGGRGLQPPPGLPAPDEFANPSGEVEDAIHDEWKAHLGPLEAVAGVEAAAREYNQAGHRLDKTVAAAKAAGASWADIGRAVGISRQSAHQRWADGINPAPVSDQATHLTAARHWALGKCCEFIARWLLSAPVEK